MPRQAKNTATKTSKRGRKASGFTRIISSERKRLERVRTRALALKAKADRDVAEVEKQLSALQAFFSAKLGSSKGRETSGSRRGYKRQEILDLIKSAPEGLSRGEIIRKLNAVEKAAQQSISNALSNLFKQNALKREGKRYQAA